MMDISKLKSVEELLEEVEAYEDSGTKLLYEAFRQLAIADYVNSLNPVAFRQNILATTNGVEKLEYGYCDIQIMQGDLALFDLSELRISKDMLTI